MGQLGDLAPLVKLGKLFQLVLLQSWEKIRNQTDTACKDEKEKPSWKLIQLCLHLHDLLKQGEHCCWDHLHRQNRRDVWCITSSSTYCPQVGPHLQHSPDIGDKGGRVILGDRVELPAAGLAQPDHRALHGGSQL